MKPVQYVIQSKIPNLLISTQNYSPATSVVNIKQEIPESPSNKNLPATPKSCTITDNIQSQSAQSNTNSSNNKNDNDSEKEEDFEATENKKFVLAPTPAQLGRAPAQRRRNMGMF